VLALEYLHQNMIIYRDLKPENILLGIDGHIKLADFGLAKRLQNQESSRDSIASLKSNKPREQKAYSMCGTPEYMSPEILKESGHDMSSDWWSLGILLYELATGEPPFASKNIEQVAEDIKFEEIPHKSYFSSVFKSILKGLTHKQPDKRLGSITRGGVTAIK